MTTAEKGADAAEVPFRRYSFSVPSKETFFSFLKESRGNYFSPEVIFPLALVGCLTMILHMQRKTSPPQFSKVKNIITALIDSPDTLFFIADNGARALTVDESVLTYLESRPAENWKGEYEEHTFVRAQGMEFRFWLERGRYVLDVVKVGTWECLDAQSVLDNLDIVETENGF